MTEDQPLLRDLSGFPWQIGTTEAPSLWTEQLPVVGLSNMRQPLEDCSKQLLNPQPLMNETTVVTILTNALDSIYELQSSENWREADSI